MDSHREIFEFAASVGALEGFLFEREGVVPGRVEDWVGNLATQCAGLPPALRCSIQPGLDRTAGRAARSLAAALGEEHDLVRKLRTLIRGEAPASADDFEREKAEKAERYGGRRSPLP